MEQLSCDVLVVGAGPAGSTAALEAARKGKRVIIIDRRRVIGEPAQCAGYIPVLITQHIKLDKECIMNKIDFMRTFLPDGSTDDTKTPGFIIDRSMFDKYLVRRAAEKGARLMVGTSFHDFNSEGATIIHGNEHRKIKASVIISADGPKSTVGKLLNIQNINFIVARQYEMALKETMNHSEVYFSENYLGGYAWLFPKGKFANVGLGMHSTQSAELKGKLDDFVKTLVEKDRLYPGSSVRTTGGLVPIGGPAEKTVVKNVILAGDAAGLTHPITGAGILSAVISGKLAGKTASAALDESQNGSVDEALLMDYEHEWKSFLKSDLDLAVKRRNMLNGYFIGMFDRYKSLTEALKKSWVVFRDYYYDD